MKYVSLRGAIYVLAAGGLLLTAACSDRPQSTAQRLATGLPDPISEPGGPSSVQAIERANIENARSAGAVNRPAGLESLSINLKFLLDPAFFEETSVIESIAAEADLSYIPVLLDAMNSPNAFIWIHAIVLALETLSGQNYDYDWHAWVNWYARQRIRPAEGYVRWKGEYMGLIDPKFKEYFYDGVKHRIPIDLITWGGVRKDAIPALINPKLVRPHEASYLTSEEPVFGVSINGDFRAYPLRIMDWHELFNDVVGGVPVSLSYCTLCGAGILYDTTINGTTYTFGSSGLLYQSNKLMYDHQTNSLWNNLTGEPVLGGLADSGLELKVLPVTVSRWSDWLAAHPDTKVLSLDTGYDRDYTPGRPYGPYFASPDTMFPVTERSDRLPTKAWVYTMTLNGIAKAYPLDILQEMSVVNDTLAGTPIVLASTAGGREVRAYSSGQHKFSASPTVNSLTDETGKAWAITEEALVADDVNERLERLPGHLAFWFGWYVFFPNTLVYER